MSEHDHIELEQRLKDFFAGSLADMSQKLILDFKNMLLEHDKEMAKVISSQDKEILMIKKDIQQLQHDHTISEQKMNEFKKETREKLSELTQTEDKMKGAGATLKWIVGGGIIGWIVLLINIGLKIFGG